MQPVIRDAYRRIDNACYNARQDIWWDENAFLHLLKTSLNPCRFGYFLRTFREVLGRDPWGVPALDVGCGGGLLAEEFAAAGFAVTGVDPCENALQTARAHAARNGLRIDYRTGTAEELPFPDASFEVVYCCDVLEHVENPARCLAEMARVTRPGGVFFFDTVNRTWMSRLVLIKLLQDWKRYALFAPGLHVYEMFIKPAELQALCRIYGMPVREVKGMAPRVNPLVLLGLLRRRAMGRISYAELGERFKLMESDDVRVSYMGYSLKGGE